MSKKIRSTPATPSRLSKIMRAAWNNPQKTFFYTSATILGGMIAFNATFNQKPQVPTAAHAASQNAAKKSMMRDAQPQPTERPTLDASASQQKTQAVEESVSSTVKDVEKPKQIAQSEMEALIQTTAATAVATKMVAQKTPPVKSGLIKESDETRKKEQTPQLKTQEIKKTDVRKLEAKQTEVKKNDAKKSEIKSTSIDQRKKTTDSNRMPLQLMPPKNVELQSKTTQQEQKNIKTVQALKTAQSQTNNPSPIIPTQKSLTPSARVVAAQKALNRLGYGPIKADGVMGLTTKKALELFEKDRKMSVTGDLVSPTRRVLASQSGIPIN